ncbi:MAG: DNA repair exonuclease [Clostridia bacterium]|nr:DNA repair exonuclease [Clostridia bacterium]
MRFVHTADNHLDSPMSSLPPNKALMRRDMRLVSFSKIIDYTIHNADMLLISGDLFDTPNPPQSVFSFCVKEFERLGDIPVFIALGNHDYLNPSLHFPGNVHVFPADFETVSFKNCRITGASFIASAAFFADRIPPATPCAGQNLLLLHGDIFTQSDYNSMNKDALSALGYDYVALGHIHEHFKYKSIVYPGCHDGAGFDEAGEKGFIYGDFSKGSLSLEFIPSSSLVYRKEDFDVSAFTSSSAVADAIMEKFPDGIYKFYLTGTPQDDFVPNTDAIEAYISQKFFHATVADNTTNDINLSDSMLFKLFEEYISKNAEGDIAALALRYGTNALKGDMR